MKILGAVTVLVVGALLWLAVPAMAHHTDQDDPRDTPGKLDLRTVAFDHDGTPTWRFVTFGRWTVQQLWDQGFLMVQLDTKGGSGIDYILVVRSTGTKLQANMFRLRPDGREVKIKRLRTHKTGSRAAWVALKLSKVVIGSHRTSYFWSAMSSFIGTACHQTCFDTVPDDGMVEQTLSTSPTPSPTPPTGPTG